MSEKGTASPVVASGTNSPSVQTAPTKKAAAPKSKKPRAKPTHPRTAEMVETAISSLKERSGSSLQAIKKYIASTYKIDAEKQAPFIKKYLKAAVLKGALVQTKGKGAAGSFKLSGKVVETTKPKVAVTVKAAPPKKAAVVKKPVAAKKAPTPKKPIAKKTAASSSAEKRKVAKGPAAKPPKAKTVASTKAKAAKSPIKKQPKAAQPKKTPTKPKRAAPKKAGVTKK
ncbi:histone H1 [Orussus abietinus]|uniref:histone H1 n=1 Tax=Orussus abietinus TaxID=222816 RepID=UPI00062567E2|nr:histone H1 [Orussus abietinus]